MESVVNTEDYIRKPSFGDVIFGVALALPIIWCIDKVNEHFGLVAMMLFMGFAYALTFWGVRKWKRRAKALSQ